ncbi:MAG: thioesterase family protein [Tardiphaga sp.]
MDFIYRIDGHHVVTSPYAAGPWNATMQHGSAPSALVTYLAEQMPTASPMQIVRVTVDLLRPVPVAELTFETEVLREGRKIQLCGITLFANGVIVARATVLKIRAEPQPLPPEIADPPLELPGPDSGLPLARRAGNAFMSGLSTCVVRGGLMKSGPGAIWYRLDRPFIEGAATSQVMRAVVAADFSNGTSAALPFEQWTFLNADLSVSLARPPVGDWILLDSESWIGPGGAGLAASKLADVNGYFGRAVQSLVIEKR